VQQSAAIFCRCRELLAGSLHLRIQYSSNATLIEGDLVRDPELSCTTKGTAVCKFSVACNRSYKQGDGFQKEVAYFDISCWTRLAEVCGEYLKKGRGVRVVGRLKQDGWTDADGQGQEEAELVEAANPFCTRIGSTFAAARTKPSCSTCSTSSPYVWQRSCASAAAARRQTRTRSRVPAAASVRFFIPEFELLR
jgi:single stranded DNA-binding protein